MPDIVLSSDSHIWEPPLLWEEWIEPAFRDRAPRLDRAAEGDRFVCEDAILSPFGADQKRDEFGEAVATAQPARFEEVMRKGAYDPHARIEDMKLDGLAGEVIYPTVTLELFTLSDLALREAVFRAYNDWIADYCAAYPDQLKALGVIDTTDIDHAIAEMERVKKLGMVGVLISVAPGDNRYVRPEFDRFWKAATALGFPVSLHAGTAPDATPFADLTVGAMCTLSSAVQTTIVDLVYGGVFARNPTLKVLSVENGAGWAPYMMQQMDSRVFLDGSKTLQFGDEEPLRPSEYVRRNVRYTFMSDKLAVRSRDVIGVEALLWATDYPHEEGTFPHSLKVLERQFDGVSVEDQRKIAFSNTAELYGFDTRLG